MRKMAPHSRNRQLSFGQFLRKITKLESLPGSVQMDRFVPADIRRPTQVERTVFLLLAAFSTLNFAPTAVGQSIPSVQTSIASSLSQTGATLNGSVNPNGAATSCWFEWGTSANYNQATATNSIGNGSSNITTMAALTGLAPGTVYHFRLRARNSKGLASGADVVVTTLFPGPGAALTFNGSNQFVSIPGFNAPQRAFTLEAWVRIVATNQFRQVIMAVGNLQPALT